jgi:hypothetical protein
MPMPRSPRTLRSAAVRAACLLLAAGVVLSAASSAATETRMAAAEPHGVLEELSSPTGGYVRFRGWAVDPARPGESVVVALTTASKFIGYALANEHRPDAQAALDGYGEWHGFDGLTDGYPYLTPGTWSLCAHIMGTGVGLGCREVAVGADTTPPDTLLTVAPPARTTNREVRVEFTTSETGIHRVECQWDDEPLTWCTSPVVRTVPLGRHTLTLTAVDHAGNADPSPATTTFVVEKERIFVRVAAVRHGSRLEVDLGPDSADHDYRFRVQRRTDRGWRTVRRTTTRGARDMRVLDLPRGRYRVVVPDQLDMAGDRGHASLRR